MFHGLSVPYIGESELSVKKPAARTVRASLEQLSKKQLEWICISYTDEKFSKKEDVVEYKEPMQEYVDDFKLKKTDLDNKGTEMKEV